MKVHVSDMQVVSGGGVYLNFFRDCWPKGLDGGLGVWTCANTASGPVVLVRMDTPAFIGFAAFENEACLNEWLAANPAYSVLWQEGGLAAKKTEDHP